MDAAFPRAPETHASRGPAETPETAETAETAARLRLAVMRLSRRIRQQVSQEVTQSQTSVLASVERYGTPTLGELAAVEQVRPPSMTRQVEALVAAGLLSRTIDAHDKRFVRVELTAAGRRALQRSRSLRTAYLVKRLARLAPDERAHLGELVTLLEHLSEL
jgi:DNA-binding MarR family transcriptional regulator